MEDIMSSHSRDIEGGLPRLPAHYRPRPVRTIHPSYALGPTEIQPGSCRWYKPQVRLPLQQDMQTPILNVRVG